MLIFTKMKKDIERIIQIPEGVEAHLHESEITVKFKGKEAKRTFNLQRASISKEGNSIRVFAEKGTKREGKIIGTVAGHITNMIKGLQEDFVYKLEICNVHFPMNVKAEKDKVIIKSFLGETVDRFAKILPHVKVVVSGHEIVVSGHDKEAAGQTAANIEQATKIKLRDRRVFQDGIFLTERTGKKI